MNQSTRAGRVPAQPRPKSCKLDGCDGPADRPGTALGFCRKHYTAFKKHGDPHVTLITIGNDPTCTQDECGRPHLAKGLCGAHYADLRASRQPPCSVDGCDRPIRTKGLCQPHYQRHLRLGTAKPERPIITDTPEGSQWCNQCQQVKPLTDFGTSKARHRGVTSFCRDCISLLCRTAWRDTMRERGDVWRKQNPERAAEQGRRWRQANPEKVRAKQRRLKANNPERYRQYAKNGDHNRRARERDAPGRTTTSQRLARWAYFGGLCWMCGTHADVLDHVKPLARGGSNWPANLRPACTRCNQRKLARWPYPMEVVRAGSAQALAETDHLHQGITA